MYKVKEMRYKEKSKCHNLAALNPRGLAKPTKRAQLCTVIRRRDIAFLGVSEMRWKGAQTVDEYTIIGNYQVGAFIHKGIVQGIHWKFWESNSRILIVHLPKINISVIVAYCPVDNNKPERKIEQEEFWKELDLAYETVCKEGLTLVMGDLNAHLTLESISDMMHCTMTSKGFNDETNFNGGKLEEFTMQHQLTILNFVNKRSLTVKEATRVTHDSQSIIDYIMIPTYHANTAKTANVTWANPLKSDHRIVEINFKMIYHKPTLQTIRDHEEECSIKPVTILDERYAELMQLIFQEYCESNEKKKPAEPLEEPLLQDLNEEEIMTWDTEEQEAVLNLRTQSYVSDMQLYLAIRMTRNETRAISQVINRLNRPSNAKFKFNSMENKTRKGILNMFQNLLGPTQPKQAHLEQFRHKPPPLAIPPIKPTGTPTIAYIDGSYNQKNPLATPGCGIVLIAPGQEPEYFAFKCKTYDRIVSNNRAELAALVFAMQKAEVMKIYTDSKVTLEIFNKIALHAPNNFQKLEHHDLWRQCAHLKRQKSIEVIHISAHKGVGKNLTGTYDAASNHSYHNEAADKLAKCAAQLATYDVTQYKHRNDLWWNVKPGSQQEHALISQMLNQWHRDQWCEPTLIRLKSLEPMTIGQEDFAMEELEIALSSLKNNKAGGFGEVHLISNVLKSLNPKTKEELLEFYNRLATEQKVPIQWLHSTLVLLQKDAKLPFGEDNVRGIALQSITAKILHRMVINRLWQHNILPQQTGFRSGMSTEIGIRAVNQCIEDARNQRKTLHLVFVDLRKAFDSVPRNLLNEILTLYGITGRMRNLLLETYHEKVHVRYAPESYEQPFAATQGTQQGGVSSPLIFNFLVDIVLRNVLPYITSKLIAYADDIVMFHENPMQLQNDLQCLANALRTVNLDLNHKKTQIISMEINEQYSAHPTANSVLGQSSMHIKRNIHQNQFPNALHTKFVQSGTGIALYIPHAENDKTHPVKCPSCTYAKPHIGSAFIKHCQNHCGFREKIWGDPLQPILKPFTVIDIPDHRPYIPFHRQEQADSDSPMRNAFEIDGIELDQVDTYKHLGIQVHIKGHQVAIAARIRNAWKAFYKVGFSVWHAKHLSMQQKRTLYRTYVEPILVYGMAAINLKMEEEAKLEACYVAQLRHIAMLYAFELEEHKGIKDHFPNEYVLEAMNMPDFSDLMLQGRCRIYRQTQLLAAEGHPIAILTQGDEYTKHLRGSPNPTWHERLEIQMAERKIDPSLHTHPGIWNILTKAPSKSDGTIHERIWETTKKKPEQ